MEAQSTFGESPCIVYILYERLIAARRPADSVFFFFFLFPFLNSPVSPLLPIMRPVLRVHNISVYIIIIDWYWKLSKISSAAVAAASH